MSDVISDLEKIIEEKADTIIKQIETELENA